MAMKHSLDHFCAILETLASSDHDYAGFVRKISLERASMAEVCRAERGAGADHSYTNGKLINTLLNIVLRRTSCLESFRYVSTLTLNLNIPLISIQMGCAYRNEIRYFRGSRKNP